MICNYVLYNFFIHFQAKYWYVAAPLLKNTRPYLLYGDTNSIKTPKN